MTTTKPIRIYLAPHNPGWYFLDGVSGRTRRYWQLLGWEWVHGVGCPGVYRTRDGELVRKTTMILGVGLTEYLGDRS